MRSGAWKCEGHGPGARPGWNRGGPSPRTFGGECSSPAARPPAQRGDIVTFKKIGDYLINLEQVGYMKLGRSGTDAEAGPSVEVHIQGCGVITLQGEEARSFLGQFQNVIGGWGPRSGS